MNELLTMPSDELKAYDLVVGHFEFSVRTLMDNPLCMTMLRDPVQRVLSYYRFIRSASQHASHERFQALDLRDIFNDPKDSMPVRNHQTRLFGRDFNVQARRQYLLNEQSDSDPAKPPFEASPTSLKLAQRRISNLSFVGLTERFQESLQLLCYSFGWVMPKTYEKMNVTPKPKKRAQESEAILTMIRNANIDDQALYDHASALFNSRYAAMREEIARQLSTPVQELTDQDINAYLFEPREPTKKPSGQDRNAAGKAADPPCNSSPKSGVPD